MSLECLKSVQENLELEKEAVLQNWDGGGQTQKKVLVYTLGLRACLQRSKVLTLLIERSLGYSW